MIPSKADSNYTLAISGSMDKLNQFKILILLPFFTSALYFLLTFIIFPFYIYRSLVSLLAKWLDPQISRVLTSLSASLLRDYESHSTKPLSTIVVCLKGHGSLNVRQFREVFKSRIIEKRTTDGSGRERDLQFPELQQHYKHFMGYLFLRWDTNFKLEEHVKTYHDEDNKEDKVLKGRDLEGIWQDLMVKPFKSRTSPWEALFLENFEEENGGNQVKEIVIFLRIHHGIADGFSVQQMLCNLDPTYYSTAQNPKSTSLHTSGNTFFRYYKTALFSGPYDLLCKMILYKEPYHTFHLPTARQRKEYFVVESPVMLVENVKRIKTHFGVGFTTVLLAVLCGGIRRFLERNPQRAFPELHCLGIPLTTMARDDSNRLGNNFLIAPLNLPIEVEHPLQRLHLIERQLVQLSRSSITKMLGLCIDALSCLPLKIMKRLTKRSVFSTAYSTLPGPSQRITLASGAQLDQVSFAYGSGAASLGLCFSSITYLAKFRITIFVDKALMEGRRDKAEDMITALTQEYQHLTQLSTKQ